jgi:hypothetical protein
VIVIRATFVATYKTYINLAPIDKEIKSQQLHQIINTAKIVSSVYLRQAHQTHPKVIPEN